MGRETTRILPSAECETKRQSAAGERIEAVDERGTSRSQFDARGRLLRLQDADGGVIEYSYDAVGNLLTRSSPSQTLLYRYDARNRLTEVERRVQGEAPALTRYSYDAAGRRSAMEGGDGTRTEYAYDSRHRLRGLVKRGALGALLMGMGYQVDADGLRTQISEADSTGLVRTVQYDYDAVKRLVAERIDHRIDLQDRQASWSYDRVGNRLRQSVSEAGAAAEVIDYTYDTNDRLQSERGAQIADYTYDAAGNLLSHGTPTGTTEYVYNDAGRMREARSAGEVNAYVYNADGLRVRHTLTPAGGTSEQALTTWSLQDPTYAYAQEIERWTSTGSAPRRRIAVYSIADDLISQTRYDAADTASTNYVQADGFGSTRWLTDATGVITDTVDYDAFGNEIGRSGTTEVEHLYRGEAFDPNVGFYYLRARWMDPRVGRFTQQDAFAGFGSDPISLHKYLYANSGPINLTDPSGYMSVAEQGAVSTGTGILAQISTAALRVHVVSARMASIIIGNTPVLSQYGQRFGQMASGAGLRGYTALQSHVHSVVRLGGASLNDIQRSYNLGAGYTSKIAQIFGHRASQYGLHMHKFIESSFGAPSSVTYSVAKMAPTSVRVHQMISAAHSTTVRTLTGQSMTLREYCRYMLYNRHIALEKMHLAQAEIWVLANRLNGAPVPVRQAKAIVDQYATRVP